MGVALVIFGISLAFWSGVCYAEKDSIWLCITLLVISVYDIVSAIGHFCKS